MKSKQTFYLIVYATDDVMPNVLNISQVSFVNHEELTKIMKAEAGHGEFNENVLKRALTATTDIMEMRDPSGKICAMIYRIETDNPIGFMTLPALVKKKDELTTV